MQAQSGMSLIELMIALLIGLILMLGVIQVFSASSNAYRLAKGTARLQEGGRFAMDYLSRDLRMAGHMGCSSDQILTRDGTSLLTSRTTFGATDDAALQFNYAIRGYEASGTAPKGAITLASTPTVGGAYSNASGLPARISNALTNRVSGSDILVLRYLEGQGLPITTAVNSGTPNFTISPSTTDWSLFKGGITTPGLFGITTCDNAIVFQAKTASATSVTVAATTLNAGLSAINFQFPQGAELYRAESEVYYVGLNSDSRPSLYRARFTAAPDGGITALTEELVEGVESMQLLYGQDSPTSSTPGGSVTQLVTADQIDTSMSSSEAAWRRVITVQIGLVMASPEVASATQVDSSNTQTAGLTAQGVTFTAPNDGRARTVYQSTVTLRNRLYGN
ncbi:type IV pilus assembly protein PilW [Pseudoxanthomonas sp. GM95]|uniref:PilW family protein n=1 Tax=Pseudoxanthomonas sp. GM95 TaxID=1881043 RepID=UPI0008B10E97|nr:PilW family protein [Pseudoxanthomonas sp. GM95]SEL73984.1 type IV pilus assembly protein PilW [Pseudoxanthomonas sp. GM95]